MNSYLIYDIACIRIISSLIALLSAVYAVRRWGRIALLLVFYLFNGGVWVLAQYWGSIDWQDTQLLRLGSYTVGNGCLLWFLIAISRRSEEKEGT
jgi:hypothetical protein